MWKELRNIRETFFPYTLFKMSSPRSISPQSSLKDVKDTPESKNNRSFVGKCLITLGNKYLKASADSKISSWPKAHRRMMVQHFGGMIELFGPDVAQDFMQEILRMDQSGAIYQYQLPDFDNDDTFITQAHRKLYKQLRRCSSMFYSNAPCDSTALSKWMQSKPSLKFDEVGLIDQWTKKKQTRRYLVEAVISVSLNEQVFQMLKTADPHNAASKLQEIQEIFSDKLNVSGTELSLWKAWSYHLLLKSESSWPSEDSQVDFSSPIDELIAILKELIKPQTLINPKGPRPKELESGLNEIFKEASRLSLILKAQRAEFQFFSHGGHFISESMENQLENEKEKKSDGGQRILCVFPGLRKPQTEGEDWVIISKALVVPVPVTEVKSVSSPVKPNKEAVEIGREGH
ncbi:hypothetical protein EDC01DRAFT_489421 [Geopyxis carbonaria]|nr:hypothetical protein EDC01DRAFT_489421 [Geopyxis carbonaria]